MPSAGVLLHVGTTARLVLTQPAHRLEMPREQGHDAAQLAAIEADQLGGNVFGVVTEHNSVAPSPSLLLLRVGQRHAAGLHNPRARSRHERSSRRGGKEKKPPPATTKEIRAMSRGLEAREGRRCLAAEHWPRTPTACPPS